MKTSTFDSTIDKGVRERANAVLATKGMTMARTLRAMMAIDMRERRLPFGISRAHALTGVGMSREAARKLGIPKDGTDGSIGVTCGVTLKVEPEERERILKWCDPQRLGARLHGADLMRAENPPPSTTERRARIEKGSNMTGMLILNKR